MNPNTNAYLHVLKRPCEPNNSWTTRDFIRNTREWQYTLTEEDLFEIADSVPEVPLVDGRPNGRLRIPKLRARLEGMDRNLVRNGPGALLIRGLPVESFTEAQLMFVYLGIGECFGNIRPQNANGDAVHHVRYRSHEDALMNESRDELFAHSDSCDTVSLLCKSRAKSGGQSTIASSFAIHNYMLERFPVQHAALFRSLAYIRKTTQLPGQLPWFYMPVFNNFRENLTVFFNKQYTDEAYRLYPESGMVSEHDSRALEMFLDLTKNPVFQYSMDLLPGDIQILNNHKIVHGRGSYEDGDTEETTRHMLRLWISHPDSVPLPIHYLGRWSSLIPGSRGGPGLSPVETQVPLWEYFS